jgi:hypothetical protein
VKSDKICVYYLEDDITLFFTLYPLLTSRKYGGEFHFTTDLDYVLNHSQEKYLLLVRFYKRREIAQDESILGKMRDRFEKVIYLDDTASADELNCTVFPYVDYYLKKQIHRDKATYLSPSYGKRAFTNYYHEKYDIEDDNEEIRPALSQNHIDKIKLGWNLGIGCYPKTKYRNGLARRVHPVLGLNGIKLLYKSPLKYNFPKPHLNKISARYGMTFDRKTVAFHRSIYEDTVNNSALFLTGRVPIKLYNQELRQVRATFSPFGWGEVCFRDFEAIINRSVLIKPDMSHIETWPDVYQDGKTYISVDWDGHNLEEKSLELLNNPSVMDGISQNALTHYLDSFMHLDDKISALLKLLD